MGLLDFMPQQMPQQQNWLDRGLANPMTHLGMGLLSSSQPKYSTNIADLNGGGIGQGLLQGAQSYTGYQGLLADRQYKDAVMQAKQQEQMLKQQEAQQKMAEEQRKQQAMMQYVSQLPPESQQQAMAFFQAGGNIDQLTDRFNPAPDKGPSSYQEYKLAYPNGEVSYEQYLTLDANRKAPKPPSVTVFGNAYQPQTQEGKLFADLVSAQKLPESPERNATIDGLKRQIAAAGKGTEAGKVEARMWTAASVADRFDELADANPNDVGLYGGSATNAKMDNTFIGKAIRVFSDQTAPEAALSSMQAQMKSQLGTALSGAAIPESEWPTYMGQVPTVTDSKSARKSKIATYTKLLDDLDAIQNKAMTLEQFRSRRGSSPNAVKKGGWTIEIVR